MIFPRRRLRRGGARGRRVEIEPTVEEVRRAEAGLRPRQPPRPQAVPKQFCCVGAGCGQIFQDKVTLRHHFEIESVVCRPLLANHPRYHAYGLWWCEKCDQWFSAVSNRHDCDRGAAEGGPKRLPTLSFLSILIYKRKYQSIFI